MSAISFGWRFVALVFILLGFFSSPTFAQADAQMGWTHNHITASDLDKRMVHKGEFADGVRWKDEGGEQTLFLCYDAKPKENARDIFIYQYSKIGSDCKMVWDIQDFGSALCEQTFAINSLQLIDLDQDGVLEACFMYQNLCDGLDPYATKLMLMTKGKKLAIRGKFAVEDGEELEKNIDPAVAQYPALFKNFMLMIWNEFKSAEMENSYTLRCKTPNFLVYEKEYLMASGGTSYALMDVNGMPMKLSESMLEKINWASDLDLMPDGKTLLYGGLKGIGTYDPVSKVENSYMTFFEDTEAISTIVWSPDKKKIAFAALNNSQYPENTRIFVLTLDGTKMVKKDKFDINLFYMAAADWVIYGPRFKDNQTLEYEAPIDLDGERQPGPMKALKLE